MCFECVCARAYAYTPRRPSRPKARSARSARARRPGRRTRRLNEWLPTAVAEPAAPGRAQSRLLGLAAGRDSRPATGSTGGPLAGRPSHRHIGRQAARQRLPAPLLCAGAKPGGRDGGGQAPLPCYDTFLVLPALLKAPSGTFIASPALLWCSLGPHKSRRRPQCTGLPGTGSDSRPIPFSSGPTCATSAWHRIGPATSSGPHVGRNRQCTVKVACIQCRAVFSD